MLLNNVHILWIVFSSSHNNNKKKTFSIIVHTRYRCVDKCLKSVQKICICPKYSLKIAIGFSVVTFFKLSNRLKNNFAGNFKDYYFFEQNFLELLIMNIFKTKGLKNGGFKQLYFGYFFIKLKKKSARRIYFLYSSFFYISDLVSKLFWNSTVKLIGLTQNNSDLKTVKDWITGNVTELILSILQIRRKKFQLSTLL